MLQGMLGAQRRRSPTPTWEAADPGVRMGPDAETFFEFDGRVSGFLDELPHLPDQCVLFGHGIWFKLLCWKLSGSAVTDSAGMQAFRRFQGSLPMPNCATYALERDASSRNSKWN